MQDHFRTYKSQYQKAHEYKHSTGAGLESDDEEKGFHTMAAKLNNMCPHYEKMDALFGTKANINPLAMFDFTPLPVIPTSDSETTAQLESAADDNDTFEDNLGEVSDGDNDLGSQTTSGTDLPLSKQARKGKKDQCKAPPSLDLSQSQTTSRNAFALAFKEVGNEKAKGKKSTAYLHMKLLKNNLIDDVQL